MPLNPVAIPQWNARGVLPPINPLSPTTADRSPYVVTLNELILRYSTSKERITILKGFLDFRNAIHRLGLTQGFQWLNGSFLENIEIIENRPPKDIDVTTFYYLPSGVTQEALINKNRRLFNAKFTKKDYLVDAYFVQLDDKNIQLLIRNVIYWYSLWSHRRDDIWKGYLQIDLAPTEDVMAWDKLNLL